MTSRSGTPVLSAGTITGDEVKNRQGESLGTIKELMIDTATGRVAYAVLDFGGFLGIGNKLFAVPWSALTISPEEKCFKMQIDRQVLENAEGFDKDHWPDFADTAWAERIHNHYNAPPYWRRERVGQTL